MSDSVLSFAEVSKGPKGSGNDDLKSNFPKESQPNLLNLPQITPLGVASSIAPSLLFFQAETEA